MKTGNLKNAVALDASLEGLGRYGTQLRVARWLAVVAIFLSAMMLSGWLFDVDVWTRVAPDFDPITSNAAAAFLLLGILLYLSASHTRFISRAAKGARERWIMGLAIIVALIGLLTLLEYAFDADFGIDRLMVIGHGSDIASYPERMSLLSALTILLLGGVFLLRSLRLTPLLREWLALSAFVAGYLALMGYVYGAETLYRIGATAMQVQSAICTVLIAIGCLLLPPHYGLMRPVVSRGAGGLLIRRLLPVALFVAPAVDWVQARAAAQMGEFSLALVGLANVALLVFLVWSTGKAVQLAHSAQKTTEASLRETNEALIRSNVELQRFAHVAAHDLQTPLRGIGGFAELLKMHYESRLDKQGQDWLSRILHSAAQLQSLVRDLLQYSSIETQPLPTEAVDMNEVLDRVLRLLASAVQDTQATITHTDLPVVSGDASQLTQLLLNLISNAIKYRSSSSPNVHIAAERSTDTWVFSVRDNGIGIEPRHMERIFDLFERLHTAEQYQGTGIGLSICRRVVQRHGGNIWVESQLGIGSTFFFTLPIRPSLAQ